MGTDHKRSKTNHLQFSRPATSKLRAFFFLKNYIEIRSFELVVNFHPFSSQNRM
jgi:hypothetical protein